MWVGPQNGPVRLRAAVAKATACFCLSPQDTKFSSDRFHLKPRGENNHLLELLEDKPPPESLSTRETASCLGTPGMLAKLPSRSACAGKNAGEATLKRQATDSETHQQQKRCPVEKTPW